MGTPSDKGLDNKAVMEWIKSAYKSEIGTGFDIIIKNVKLLDKTNKNDLQTMHPLTILSKDVIIHDENQLFATYEEWQTYKDETKNTIRKSTVAFTNGLHWLA